MWVAGGEERGVLVAPDDAARCRVQAIQVSPHERPLPGPKVGPSSVDEHVTSDRPLRNHPAVAQHVLPLIGGVEFISQLYNRKAIFPRYIPVPMWIIELCIPLGMFIFTLYSLLMVRKVLKKKW